MEKGKKKTCPSTASYHVSMGLDPKQRLCGTIVRFDSTIPPAFKKGEARVIVVVASFSQALIFRNYLGSQHWRLISAGNRRGILYRAHPRNSKFSIQLSNHFNLIISSWEALYGIMCSRAARMKTLATLALRSHRRGSNCNSGVMQTPPFFSLSFK